jgi:hypothetical protein
MSVPLFLPTCTTGGRSARLATARETVLLRSFDVFFQRFTNGEADPGGGERMRQVLEPFIVREESQSHFALVEYGDGSADVYLDSDGMMANHVSGERARGTYLFKEHRRPGG